MEQKLTDIESQLILLTRRFLLEQKKELAMHAVSLDASLERQLGIDSLSKVELLHRIEKTFALRFSNAVMAQVDTLKQIAQAILETKPTKKFKKQTFAKSLERLEIDLSKINTLQQTLIEYALVEPERPHIYLRDEEDNEEIISYGSLLNKASSIANGLIEQGIRPDDTVAIMLPTSSAFFQSFFGVLLAGAIPVPIYPPFRPDRIEEYAVRETKILNNAEVRILITFAQAKMLSKLLKSYVPSLKAVVSATHLSASKSSLPKVTRDPDQAALLQYTSGSTGDPKGILLSNKNILTNLKALSKAIHLQPTDVAVSWLPLYHDMGLMSWLGALYFGIPIIILSPLSFLSHPESWLWAIHYHRATLSSGPNFAYELCVNRIDENRIEGLDLSSWRLAFNGAEAINPRTLSRFYNKFERYRLKKETLFPVYGLAENTVALTLPKPNSEPHIDRIDREPFEQHQYAAPTNENKNYLEFVSVGKVITDHEIRIVDDQDNVLAQRHVGNIQFRGPSAMQGYYRNSQATAATYHQGWWDTNDLGYIAAEELFITGRRKDLIIKAGRNLYPEVFEHVAENITNVRKGCVIAFGITDPKIGTEKIIIVAETKLPSSTDQLQLQHEIIEKISTEIGVPPDEVVLTPPHTIPKTSSGKLQRSTCKQDYLAGKLIKKHKTTRRQVTRLFFTALGRRILHWLNISFRCVYTLYAWLVFIVLLLPIWLITLVSPRNVAAWVIKYGAKGWFLLMFRPIKVVYKKDFSIEKPVIYVANHTSYSDTLVLLAVLPTDTIFVAKKELLNMPILASLMKKLQCITVDRWDFTQNITNTKHIRDTLTDNYSILIFPEGTFTYASGLRPFKTGAFKLAVDTQAPICPIAIKGTRKLLRGGTLLIAPSKITVTFCQPIRPQGHDWQQVNLLNIKAHKIIATYCGEPTINIIAAGPEHTS